MEREPDWAEVDGYLVSTLVGEDPVLDAALAANSEAGLPPIDVAPNQGKLLNLLARMCLARNVLEIGTLGGYSTIWLARAVGPSGQVITLEFDPTHADVARANIERAELADRVDIRVGAALDSLPSIAKDELGPFDLVFIDADKENNTEYVRWALALSHPGTVIIVDNVVRGGTCVQPGYRRRARQSESSGVGDDRGRAETRRHRHSNRGFEGMGRVCRCSSERVSADSKR